MIITNRSVVARMTVGAAAGTLIALLPGLAVAQRAAQTKEGASIIVDGVVREVFRSPRQSRVDFVVQIEVNRSEYGRAPADPRRVQAPAPGDQIYVHVFQPSAGDQARPGAGHTAIPAERSHVRAYLYPRPQGGWDGAFPDWFDQTNVDRSLTAARTIRSPRPRLQPPLRVGHPRRPPAGRSSTVWA